LGRKKYIPSGSQSRLSFKCLLEQDPNCGQEFNIQQEIERKGNIVLTWITLTLKISASASAV